MLVQQLQADFGRIEDSTKRFSDHLKNLATAHGALLSNEVDEQKKRVTTGSALLGAGAIVALTTLLILSVAAAEVLIDTAEISRAAAYGIVGLVLLVITGVLAYTGISNLKQFSPVPNETLASLKETITCVTKKI
jgi:uncharacterized membrane protein YqjE